MRSANWAPSTRRPLRVPAWPSETFRCSRCTIGRSACEAIGRRFPYRRFLEAGPRARSSACSYCGRNPTGGVRFLRERLESCVFSNHAFEYLPVFGWDIRALGCSLRARRLMSILFRVPSLYGLRRVDCLVSASKAASPNGRCCAALLGRTLLGDNLSDTGHQGVLRLACLLSELGKLAGHRIDCRVEFADLLRELVHLGIN